MRTSRKKKRDSVKCKLLEKKRNQFFMFALFGVVSIFLTFVALSRFVTMPYFLAQ